ncbi:hypothetical protein AAL_03702 [Moelleriella libera RCEF 2490]|uniref:Uncharacterized protein n=1 Tax=Moelleriella libera RCEF 2490 TaxID=1081109 RepID=A0A168DH11_9HYPO|nr:hypothetical protein AAL_03702 [Moelleriella libera RCEF 2490]
MYYSVILVGALATAALAAPYPQETQSIGAKKLLPYYEGEQRDMYYCQGAENMEKCSGTSAYCGFELWREVRGAVSYSTEKECLAEREEFWLHKLVREQEEAKNGNKKPTATATAAPTPKPSGPAKKLPFVFGEHNDMYHCHGLENAEAAEKCAGSHAYCGFEFWKEYKGSKVYRDEKACLADRENPFEGAKTNEELFQEAQAKKKEQAKKESEEDRLVFSE